MTRLCIDLCSGLEGMSQAFKRAEGWQVVTIDIERKFNRTIVAGIRFLPLRANVEPEALLAGPPCERFSVACHTWPKMGIKLAMELVGACLEAVAYLKPKHWLIENPMGRLRWFLGTPAQTVRLCDYGTEYQKKTDLWGNITLPLIREQRMPRLYLRPPNATAKRSQSALTWMAGHNKAARAKMPEGLSLAILEAVSQ